jgi:hypothetical protein
MEKQEEVGGGLLFKSGRYGGPGGSYSQGQVGDP